MPKIAREFHPSQILLQSLPHSEFSIWNRTKLGHTKEKDMGRHDLELERARFLSLALEFGFDEESANKCLDRLITLYGNSPLAHSISDKTPCFILSVLLTFSQWEMNWFKNCKLFLGIMIFFYLFLR